MQTIFANATPIIKSGVAVIRISGNKAFDALNILIKGKLPQNRYSSLRKIYNPQTNNIIDEALVIIFKTPNSFTGEDVVEIHCHGSIAVISQIFSVLSKIEDLRLAEAGEFSKRAFENGKMDLTQAEGLADLIEAETTAQAKQAVKQMQGANGKLYESWRSKIINICAQLEAYIDFPDEEIPEEVLTNIDSEYSYLKKQISNHLDDNKVGQRIKNGLTAVIIGAPNAGKSSLMNLLVKGNVAIVSDIAGTTRDLIETNLDIKGYPLSLIDSAGLRDTNDAIEEEGVKRAINKAKDADFKLAIFDVSQDKIFDDKTFDLIDENTILIFNKIDIVNDGFEDYINNYNLNNQKVFISTKEGAGVEDLNNILIKICENLLQTTDAPVITNQRHRNLLNETLSFLGDFDLNKELELSAQDLRFACNALGKITGRIDIEDVLDALFSQFCIGK